MALLRASDLLIAAAALAPVALAQTSENLVRVSGSTTVFARVFEKGRANVEREASVRVLVVANGSRQGLSDLVAGKSEIAMLSARLEEITSRMPAAERPKAEAADLVTTPLGETRLAFIVHPSNAVRTLPIDRIGDLFSGRVTNWKDVGGPDLPVVVVSNQFSSGQRALLE